MKNILIKLCIVFVGILLTLVLASCGDTKKPTITEHVHTFGDWYTVTEASCEADGKLARICSSCKFEESTKIQKTGHKFAENVKSPDCESQGYTEYTCACGYSYKSDFKASTGHKTVTKTLEPTCVTEGYTEHTCACGYSYKSDFKAPIPHDTVETVKEPTCTEEGSHTYDCKNCDYSYTVNDIPPTGHTYEKTTYRPTAISAGYTHYACDCGHSYDGDHVFYSEILEYAYTENTEVLSKGLDVSKWEHETDKDGNYLPLDWAAIKAAGYDFVILKAGSTERGDGGGIDPVFEMNYRDAKAAGLEVGAYFYTYATTVEGVLKDAELCMSWLRDKQFEYPIYFDLEDPELESLGKNHLTDMCVAFICALQENGYYSGLYVNNHWLRNILDAPKILTLFDVWYARYPSVTDGATPEWDSEKYGNQLGMWQYTEEGIIEGFDTDFDFNFSYKNYKELMIKWGLNGFESV